MLRFSLPHQQVSKCLHLLNHAIENAQARANPLPKKLPSLMLGWAELLRVISKRSENYLVKSGLELSCKLLI